MASSPLNSRYPQHHAGETCDPSPHFFSTTSVDHAYPSPRGMYYSRAHYQTTEGGYAPITEAVLVFAITGIREDARGARADKEAVRDELEEAANRVSDLRTRPQRSELTAAALLDSLQRSQDASPVARKHLSFERRDKVRS
jgi:hypothetical protein